jgi:hypothetical protein
MVDFRVVKSAATWEKNKGPTHWQSVPSFPSFLRAHWVRDITSSLSLAVASNDIKTKKNLSRLVPVATIRRLLGR